MVKHVVATEELANIIQDWKDLEDDTISLANHLLNDSSNDFVKVIMEMIKRDSEKHKVMQKFVIDHLTKKAFHLTPQELIPLADVLEKHIQAEAKSMSLANKAKTKSKDFFVNFMISYLMADEVKHHEMLTMLDQIKGQVYPYGTVRPDR